jgi:hypothetical protein
MNILRKRKVSLLAVAALVCLAGASASAGNVNASQEFLGNATVGFVMSPDGGATWEFGVTLVPPYPTKTCSWWGVQFRFDGTTTQGKNLYAMLLTAKTTGKPIHIWYEDSTTPGTDQTNGCTESTVSVADSIGMP